MEFRIPIATLLPALARANSIADRKSTMPMLANVCLRAGADRLKVVGTDLDLTIASELPMTGVTPGGLTLNAKALHDIVANLPGAEVSIGKVQNNWAEIKAGKVKYRIVGMPDRDFPKVPDVRKAEFCTVDAGALLGMLRATQATICNDGTRFHLHGVLFESDGSIARMVSTDGHRLSKAERALKGPELAAGVIIPKRGVIELRKFLDGADEAELAVDSPFLFVRRDDALLAVKLIAATFPSYDQVIPKDHRRRAMVDRELLLGAVKRCQLMSSADRGIGIKFSLHGDVLDISTENPDHGDVREEVACTFDGEPIVVAMNPKYALDLIAVLDDIDEGAIAIELGAELEPIVLRSASSPDAFLGVIMPMRA